MNRPTAVRLLSVVSLARAGNRRMPRLHDMHPGQRQLVVLLALGWFPLVDWFKILLFCLVTRSASFLAATLAVQHSLTLQRHSSTACPKVVQQSLLAPALIYRLPMIPPGPCSCCVSICTCPTQPIVSKCWVGLL
jgi:hypothetical protein